MNISTIDLVETDDALALDEQRIRISAGADLTLFVTRADARQLGFALLSAAARRFGDLDPAAEVTA